MRIGDFLPAKLVDDDFIEPAIAGKYTGNLIICGDGSCIWDDLKTFGCAKGEGRGSVQKAGWDFMVINHMVEVFPGYIDHAFSNHPEHLLAFYWARRPEYAREFPGKIQMHSCFSGVNWTWPWKGLGTSGLNAVLTGLCLGYEQIVLAGMPLDDRPHNGEPRWRKSNFEIKDVEPHWMRAKDVFEERVKSLSGRTKDWLGSPL